MSMSTITRALAVASLAAGLATATPALAGSSFCTHEGSTRLFTANDGTYKLWVDTVDLGPYNETHVCFGAGNLVRGDYSFRDGLSGTFVPTVTPTVDDPNCPRLLHVQDPVDVMTQFASNLSSNPYHLCFGLTDQAFRITLGTPSPSANPDVHLYLDRTTDVANAVCTAAPTTSGCSGTEITIDIV